MRVGRVRAGTSGAGQFGRQPPVPSHSPSTIPQLTLKPLFQELKDLIRRLLTPAPAARLGSGRRGTADVKAHPWFAALDWAALEARELPAPHVPAVSCPDDVSHFEPPPPPTPPGGRARYVSTGAFRDF